MRIQDSKSRLTSISTVGMSHQGLSPVSCLLISFTRRVGTCSGAGLMLGQFFIVEGGQAVCVPFASLGFPSLIPLHAGTS